MSANAVGGKRPKPPLCHYREHRALLEVARGFRGRKGGGPDQDDRRNQGGEGPPGLRDGRLFSSSCSLGGTPRSAPDSESRGHPPGPGRPRPTVHLGFRRGIGVASTPRSHAGLRAPVGLGPGLPPDGAFGTLGPGSGADQGCWRRWRRPVAFGRRRLRAG